MRPVILIATGFVLLVFGVFAGHTISASRALPHATQVAPFELMKNSKDLPVQIVEPAF
jgi:hypothetical protein